MYTYIIYNMHAYIYAYIWEEREIHFVSSVTLETPE